MSDHNDPTAAPIANFAEAEVTPALDASLDPAAAHGDAVPLDAAEPASARPRSLWSDAWGEMRRNPLFWVASALIVLFAVMALVPQLFAHGDPNHCVLNDARLHPSGSHWFGTDILGCDIYTRTIHGARSSILVGVLTTVFTTLLGAVVGVVAGYYGGWVDTVLSRVGEVFFAIPLLLGGIVILYSLPVHEGTPYIVVVLKVVAAITVLGWPGIARLLRSSVMQVKPTEYVQAARALGASPFRVILRHIIPNAIAPVISVATINLGAYIAIEATLSYLGIGLAPPAISWGIAISDASGLGYIQTAPWMLLFPSLFLSLTVLAFIMLGEVMRDALDPKLR